MGIFVRMRQIGIILLKGILRLLGLLPLKVHYALSGFLTFLASDVLHYRRQVVDINLARSFPDKEYGELKQIRKQFYRHFGEVLAEAVWFGGCLDYRRLQKQRIAVIDNPEEFTRLYNVSPSVIILTSHTGNWELTGGLTFYSYDKAVPEFNERNVKVVYRRLSSKVWDKVMNDNRIAPLTDKAHFDGYLESSEVLRYAISHKDEKNFYIMITDQYPYEIASGMKVNDFMHQKTVSIGGGAHLAHKYGYSVVYLGMRSESRGHYSIHLETVCEDARTMSVREIMDRYYELLQRDIEAQPWNYLWTHKRWKKI